MANILKILEERLLYITNPEDIEYIKEWIELLKGGER
jgi:hypothetical protein